MRSNYKKLGDYIRLIPERNKDLQCSNIIGLSTKKKFIPSIANIIGTDMTTYRIVRHNQFVYCPVTSRNSDKITVALYQEHQEAIISQAYLVFEVIDENKLHPEYLMMWFRRPEFDRYARFMSHGSTRENFSWEEMGNVELPIPDITKQREIVKEYNVLVNRIALNNQLIQKLEETAQAIYKQWFVDFEFPDENGKPYKSNGGEMVESQFGEIPIGWKLTFLKDCINKANTGGDAIRKTPIVDYNTGIKCARVGDISQKREPYQWAFCNVNKADFNRFRLRKNEILVTRTATLGLTLFIDDDLNAVYNNGLIRIIVNDKVTLPLFLATVMNTTNYLIYIKEINAGSSTRPNMKIDYLLGYSFVCPILNEQKKYIELLQPIHNYLKTLIRENHNIEALKSLFFAKISM